MSNFPPIRVAVLQGLLDLRNQLQADPGALDSVDCPYDSDTRSILRTLFAVKTVEVVVEKEVRVTGDRGRPSSELRLGDADQQKVLDEIKSTLESLNTMSGEGLAVNEKIQIAKTKTGLLDQLLKMMERHTAVRKVEQFKEAVIGILDDLVDEKARETFQNRVDLLR